MPQYCIILCVSCVLTHLSILNKLRFTLFFLFALWADLYFFHLIEDGLRVIDFLCAEIPLEVSCFQLIPEFNLIELQEGALEFFTFEIWVSIYRTIMLSSLLLIPLHANPELIFWAFWLAFVDERSCVSDCGHASSKYYSASKKLFRILLEVIFKASGLGFEELNSCLGLGGGCGGCYLRLGLCFHMNY